MLWLFLKVFFVPKCIKMIFVFYFFKIIFEISASKYFKIYKTKLFFYNFCETWFSPRSQILMGKWKAFFLLYYIDIKFNFYLKYIKIIFLVLKNYFSHYILKLSKKKNKFFILKNNMW